MFRFFLFAIDPQDRALIERLVTLLENEQRERSALKALTAFIRGGRLRLKNSSDSLQTAVAGESPK